MSSLSQFFNEARPFSLTAANAITAGDLVVTIQGGDAVSPLPGQLLTRFNRDTSTGLTSLSSGTGAAVGYPAANAGSSGAPVRPDRAAFLSNGNIVELSIGDGTTSTTGLYYIVRSPSGAVVIPRTQLTAGTSANGYPCGVAGLIGGGFAYFYGSASDTALKYGVISNTGTTVLAATALITGGNTGLTNSRTASISRLTGGGFGIVAWSTGGTSTLLSWVFNASGTLQGTQQTLLSVAGGSGFATSIGASNGDFVIFVDDGSTVSGGRLWRYTSAGAAVGTVQTPFGTSGVGSNIASGAGRLVELTGGNVAVLGGNTGSGSSVRVYSSTNTAVAAALTWGSLVANIPEEGNCGYPVMTPISSGGFVVFYPRSGNPSVYVLFNSSGSFLGFGTTGFQVAIATSGISGQLFVRQAGSAGFILGFYAGNPGTPAYNFEVAWLGVDFALVGSKVNSWNNTNPSGEICFLLSPDRLTAHVFGFSNTLYVYQTIGTFGCSIFGVAATSAAAGGQFVTNTVGSYTYNQTFAGASLSFDRRASTPFGNRGAVMGQTALLFGVQTAA